MRAMTRRWRRLPAVDVLTDRDTTGFLALSALVGVGVGLGASALVLVINGIAEGFATLEDLAGQRWWVLIAVPLGFLVSWWVAKRFAPEVEGDGVPDVIAALGVGDGRIRGRVVPAKIVATALNLGGGGSGGREGPIVQIGGAVGSLISRFFHLGPDQITSLVAAGAGAGIGASFNAPIAGMLFAMEVILGSFAVRHLSAIVIASVVAAITSRSIVGEELTIRAASYTLEDPRQLMVFVLLSALAAFAGVGLLRGVDLLDRWGLARPKWKGWRPVMFGLIVGAIGLFEPAVLGTGQNFLSRVLVESDLVERAGIGGTVWWALILLAMAKLVATAFTTTSGAAGGAFFPSLFIGANLGAGLGRLLEPIWGFGTLKPGSMAVVGMATVIAAVARAPLTAMMIAFELTGARDYGLVLPLMLGTVMATFIADRFHSESLYSGTLRRRGMRFAPHGEGDLLDTVVVGDVMHQPHATATPDQTLAEAQQRMSRYRYNGLAVVDDGRVVGVVTVADLIRAGGPSDSIPVSQVMTTRPVTVTPSTQVSQAMERLASLGIGRLPVVAEDGSGKFVGLFRREEAVRAYHRALGNRTDRELGRRRLDQRTDPGVGYFDFRVPAGSIADGKLVREIAWPEGSTLVSVRRDREVIIPSGATNLIAGDVVTAFGTPSSRNEMIERLNAGADEPTAELSLEEIQESGA